MNAALNQCNNAVRTLLCSDSLRLPSKLFLHIVVAIGYGCINDGTCDISELTDYMEEVVEDEKPFNVLVIINELNGYLGVLLHCQDKDEWYIIETHAGNIQLPYHLPDKLKMATRIKLVDYDLRATSCAYPLLTFLKLNLESESLEKCFEKFNGCSHLIADKSTPMDSCSKVINNELTYFEFVLKNFSTLRQENWYNILMLLSKNVF